MIDLIVSRAFHVLGVVIWIGGVAMATLVVLPAVRRGEFGPDKLAAFHAVERRFVWIARAAVLLVGITGLYMVERLDMWARFSVAAFWWMHAMVFVWTLFAIVLFVGEPLILRRYFPILVRRDAEGAFALLHRIHTILLTLALIAILGSVAGAHGWMIF